MSGDKGGATFQSCGFGKTFKNPNAATLSLPHYKSLGTLQVNVYLCNKAIFSKSGELKNILYDKEIKKCSTDSFPYHTMIIEWTSVNPEPAQLDCGAMDT